MKKTGAIKISNAVEFFPHQITMLGTSTEDQLAGVLDDLKTVLQNLHWKLPLRLIEGSKTDNTITANATHQQKHSSNTQTKRLTRFTLPSTRTITTP